MNMQRRRKKMNKVISREYVEKNYIPKEKIEKELKYHMELVSQIETFTLFRDKTQKEAKELELQEYAVSLLMKLLEDK